MTELSLVVKRCGRCEETKPLSEFYLHQRGPRTGRPTGPCRECQVRKGVAERSRRRSQLGEDEYLRLRRENVRASRTRRGYDSERRYRAARDAAIQALIDAHAKEFEALFRRAKYERGISVD